MAGAAAMIARAEKDLGLGEPNYLQAWYRNRNGADYSGNFAWCDAAVTRWAYDSGNHAAVCFGTDFAYTVAHASRFKTRGRWHADIGGIRRGDIVFFDWGGSNSIAAIDHVGLVTSVSGGTVFTIEGNTSNRCLRRARRAAEIAGYGRPAYGTTSQEDDVSWNDTIPKSKEFPEEWQAGTHQRYQSALARDARARLARIEAKMAGLEGADVDEDAIVRGLLAGMPAETVAALVVEEMGSEVAGLVLDGMSARLGRTDEAEG